MKKLLLKTAAVIVIVLLLCSSCAQVTRGAGPAKTQPTPAQSAADASAYASAAPSEDDSGKTPYTLLVYICGSDLESEQGLASADLAEMAKSGFDEKDMNIVVLTGGTAKWQTNGIPADTDSVWQLTSEGLKPLMDMGAKSMGDPDTLTNFIDYAYNQFPARHFGLILWDHGAGSVDGYGCDDNFDSDSLTLDELGQALADSKATARKFSFIGFDACLMATVETAWTLQKYADVLIGSEELEPGNGWNYSSLAQISRQPDITGADVGRIIADSFIKYNQENNPDEQATLSVIDLSKIQDAVDKLDAFSKAADGFLQGGQYTPIAKSRSGAKAFGSMGQHGGDVDMIDIVSIADRMKSLFPAEADALTQAVSNAVIYHKNSDNIINANGLSVYFPFADKDSTPDRVQVYKDIPFSPDYTKFVQDFASKLTGESLSDINVSNEKPQEISKGDYQITLSPDELASIDQIYFTLWAPSGEGNYYIKLEEDSNVDINKSGTITTRFDGNWTTLNGHMVCLYEEDAVEGYMHYSIPANLNSKDVDLIAVFNGSNPDGKIIGARPVLDQDTGMPSKNLIRIRNGDKIKLEYYAEQFSDDNGNYDESQDPSIWCESDEWTVNGGLKLAHGPADSGDYLYGFEIKDYQQNDYYTDFIQVSY
jgi:Clostripain family.